MVKKIRSNPRRMSSMEERINFLESLIGMRVRVHISYQNRNGKRGDTILPTDKLCGGWRSPDSEFYFLDKHRIDLNPMNLKKVSYLSTKGGGYIPFLNFESFGINNEN